MICRSECRIDLHKYWNGSNDEMSARGGPEEILFLPEHLPWLDDHCQSILDIGCGSGHMVNYWLSKGKEAFGITYQAKEIDLAATAKISTIILGDAHKLPWPDNTFDGIFMWDVLEHTLSPFIVLKEAWAVTKPNGHGLVFIPGDKWATCKYHILCPTILQMKHLCKLTGWEVTEVFDDPKGCGVVYYLRVFK